ncbi:IPT/TIG domain-containing protein [Candidatus Woesebacteria bacterium]|nr:IPT/TIG domain-containing protein [Candidatus Woesebacteria bacterium]
MTDNIYERIHKTLSWNRIIAFNLVLFLVLIVPISVRLAQQDTENRSSAAEELPMITPPPSYPSAQPKIDRVSTFFGKTGDTVIVLGTNFGDYQWDSKVYVGNVEAEKDGVVRWSNSIIEVKIPAGARSGAVWVNVNAREAKWDGNLLLYDVTRVAQIGFEKISSTQGKIFTSSATGATKGMVEIAYVSEPLEIKAMNGVIITSQTPLTDSLGKKLRVGFEALQLNSSKTPLIEYSYPGLGNLEIIRAELYDQSGRLLSIVSDPLLIKVMP